MVGNGKGGFVVMEKDNILNRIQDIFTDIEETVYSETDLPANVEKHLSNEAVIKKDQLDELREQINQLNSIQPSSLLDQIAKLIHVGSPIEAYSSFDEFNYASKLLQFEDGEQKGETAAQKAGEKRAELLHQASQDIDTLLVKSLPTLLETENE